MKTKAKNIGVFYTSLRREGDRLGYVNLTDAVSSEPNVNPTNKSLAERWRVLDATLGASFHRKVKL